MTAARNTTESASTSINLLVGILLSALILSGHEKLLITKLVMLRSGHARGWGVEIISVFSIQTPRPMDSAITGNYSRLTTSWGILFDSSLLPSIILKTYSRFLRLPTPSRSVT